MQELMIHWIGGNCPVQAEGTIGGKPFYFRARGNQWSLEVGDELDEFPEWTCFEDYGDKPFDAGWMTEDEARGFIEKAAAAYLSRQQNEHATDDGQPDEIQEWHDYDPDC